METETANPSATCTAGRPSLQKQRYSVLLGSPSSGERVARPLVCAPEAQQRCVEAQGCFRNRAIHCRFRRRTNAPFAPLRRCSPLQCLDAETAPRTMRCAAATSTVYRADPWRRALISSNGERYNPFLIDGSAPRRRVHPPCPILVVAGDRIARRLTLAAATPLPTRDKCRYLGGTSWLLDLHPTSADKLRAVVGVRDGHPFREAPRPSQQRPVEHKCHGTNTM